MKANEILEQIKTKGNFRLKGDFHLTKTQSNFSDALVVRDSELELNVLAWLGSRSSFGKILSRYRNYDNELKDETFPQHYPVRLMAGTGSICSGQNIFMFFPNVLGQEAKCEKEVFGLEFVDVWSNIFRQSIFPAVRRVFGDSMWLELFSLQRNLEKTIYLASIFHEVGHRVGPYRISPEKRAGLKLDDHRLNILGELATDSLLIQHLSEFPEILHFVIFQRLFWFGRSGFRNNPMSGKLNQDNDCWIGSYLWNKLLTSQIVTRENGKLRLDSQRALEMFKEITLEIDALYQPEMSDTEQIQIIDRWMKSQVHFENGNFVLPKSFRQLLSDIQDIPETPHFETPYAYSQIEDLMEAANANAI